MNVRDAMIQRKSTRAFLPKAVEKEKIISILEHAKHSPSGVNTQPWNVCVVSGKKKIALQTHLEAAFESGVERKMDYEYYPNEWVEPYKSRRKETGLLMYETLGISREDHELQKAQWKANYRAFDAPVVLLFFIDAKLETGSYLDYGMFLQSIMLLAVEEGLATCPQAALGEYPDIVRSELGMGDDKLLIGGIALGYEDAKAKVNTYRTPRITLDKMMKFYDE